MASSLKNHFASNMTCVYSSGGSSTTLSSNSTSNQEGVKRLSRENLTDPTRSSSSSDSADKPKRCCGGGFRFTSPRPEHQKKRNLLSFEQAPSYLQNNRFIRTGYRVFLNTAECLQSIFWWSNETMNIWTHLFGFAFFFGLMIHDIFVTIPIFQPTLGEKVVMLCLLMAYQATMLLSVGFHVFGARCENTYYDCLKWDVAGIILSFAAIFISGIHYAFACFPGWKAFYEILIGTMSIVVLVTHVMSKDRSFKSDRNRIIIFLVWALFGVVPTGHWTYLEGGFDRPLIQALLPRVFGMYLLIAVAFVFYATKVPERFFPGRMDFLGGSHQLWHIFIVVALYYWHETGIKYAVFRQNHPCIQDSLVSVAQRLP